jgi:hypothetical protein
MFYEQEDFTSPDAIRRVALVALACYALTAVFVLLTFAFPEWGTRSAYCFICIPPQTYAAGLSGLLLLFIDLILGVNCMTAGFARRSTVWPLAFLFLLGAACCDPTFVLLERAGVHVRPDNLALTVLITTGAVTMSGLLLLPLLALLYARHLRRVQVARH